MKKLLTQFGKELRDSTQSIISKEVLEFLHITSLTDEEVTYLTKTISGVGFDNENNIRKLCYLISNSYLPLKVIDTIFEELRDGFYFDSHSKHSIGVLSNYFENATFANLIPMFDKELIDGDEDLDLILSFDKYYQKKLGIPLKLLIMFKEIESHSDKTMTVALSHATPFEDSLGDWNDVYNRNEEINKLISEILLLTYQKTKGD
jgi:hypothetical protein